MTILGVKVDALNRQEVLARIGDFLGSKSGMFIATPNPEIILAARRDSSYRDILNSADLAVPDGIGLKLAAALLGQKIPERISGADLLPEIARMAAERGLSVGILGGRDQAAADAAASALRERGVRVAFAAYGPSPSDWNNPAVHEKMIAAMTAAAPAVLFVGFGHPKQERWIYAHRAELPSVRLFMGCGGAVDFLAGRAKRAPAFMRRAGLEWLWRLVSEPQRWRRILNAVIVFPFAVIYDSRKKRD